MANFNVQRVLARSSRSARHAIPDRCQETGHAQLSSEASTAYWAARSICAAACVAKCLRGALQINCGSPLWKTTHRPWLHATAPYEWSAWGRARVAPPERAGHEEGEAAWAARAVPYAPQVSAFEMVLKHSVGRKLPLVSIIRGAGGEGGRRRGERAPCGGSSAVHGRRVVGLVLRLLFFL